MTSVRVTHGIDALAKDAARIPTKAVPRMTKVVKKNVEQGNKVAQGIAQRKAGPHGKNAWKRLTAEMTGPLEGEFGWTGEELVGVGFRNGPPNTDLAKAADLQGPKFANDAGSIFRGLFW